MRKHEVFLTSNNEYNRRLPSIKAEYARQYVSVPPLVSDAALINCKDRDQGSVSILYSPLGAAQLPKVNNGYFM